MGQTKYQRLNANTLYEAAILFSRSSLHIGSHYRASLLPLRDHSEERRQRHIFSVLGLFLLQLYLHAAVPTAY